jgi:hypothetical protein
MPDASDIMNQGSCYNCLGLTPAETTRITLLAELLTLFKPMAATDTNSLLEYGKCFSCVGMSIADTLQLALLHQIRDAAGTGAGAPEIFSGNYGGGLPTDIPTTAQAIAFDTSNGTQWNYYGNAWH